MADLMLRDIPHDLYGWLKQRAETNHRSLHQEAIALLESLQQDATPHPHKPSAEEIMVMARQFAELPEWDQRHADEILGYDDRGLPH
jgi:plasmid stability protein